jgi:hypothetical protein
LIKLLKTSEFLINLSLTLSNELDHPNRYHISPSQCAHALCLSSSNGYSEIVQVLSKRPKSQFNKAYTFHEPLARAIRSWIQGTKKENDRQLQSRFEECAKYLITAGADINMPEKYLKTKLSPAQRLRNDGSTQALQLLDELLALSTSGSGSNAEPTGVDQQADGEKGKQEELALAAAVEEEAVPTPKKRRRGA